MSTDAFWDLAVWAHKNKEFLSVTLNHKYNKNIKVLSFQDKDHSFNVQIGVGPKGYKRIRDSDKSEDHAIWDEVKRQSETAVLHLLGGK